MWSLSHFSAPSTNVDSWNLNSTLCGRMDNLHLSSPNNIMKLEMSTDRWITFQGFKGIARSGNIFITCIKSYLHTLLSLISYGNKYLLRIFWQNVEVRFSGTAVSLEALLFILTFRVRADLKRSSANGSLQWRIEEPYSLLLKTSTLSQIQSAVTIIY